jgi:VIT1/CCC1 family predicted Fe2+/Mn2+ transporter
MIKILVSFLIFVLCATVALYSQLPFTSAIWGFSTGIWFMIVSTLVFGFFTERKSQ